MRLPRDEAVGVALSIVNSALTRSERTAHKEQTTAELREAVTLLVEGEMRILVDRESFDYARFATHVQYLIDRVVTGTAIESGNQVLYDEVAGDFPQVADCAHKASALIEERLGAPLTQEEQLYLMPPTNRISECVTGRMG